jgi:hypothetical protein
LNLPAGSLPSAQTPEPPPNIGRDGRPVSVKLTREQDAEVRKAFAAAKGSLAFDANGAPVRKYLTEPPADYRTPDPTQPAVFTEKKKKFHWWWQKKDDDTDNLAPAASASAAPVAPAATSSTN